MGTGYGEKSYDGMPEEKRMAVFLKNNTAYLECIRNSKSGRLYFLVHRRMKTLYDAFEKEEDRKQKLNDCTELINRYENSLIHKTRILKDSLKEDITLYFRQLGSRKEIDHADKRRKDYYSVVVVVKNESRYIREFILFHQAAGADRIYIYDNDSTDNLLDVLKPFLDSGFVVYRRWKGKIVQTAAYRNAVRKTRRKTKWLAMIDADEFLFSPGRSMRDSLKDYEQYPGVAVNWVMFGPNGHNKRPEGLIMKNYITTLKDRDALLNCHIKSIVQPKAVFSVTHVHYAWYKHGRCAVDEREHPVDSRNAFVQSNGRAFTAYNYREIFRINHYNTKSLEDLTEKCIRGYADGAPAARFEDLLRLYQGELAEDLTIQPLAKIVEAMINGSKSENLL